MDRRNRANSGALGSQKGSLEYMAQGCEQLVADCHSPQKDCFGALPGQKTLRQHQAQTSMNCHLMSGMEVLSAKAGKGQGRGSKAFEPPFLMWWPCT